MNNKRFRFINQLKNNSVIAHTSVGIAAGYFLLHPITMVIYWFEFNTASITLSEVLNVSADRFGHAFRLHMMPMSVAFAVIGGLAGLGSGLYFRKIQNQNQKIQSQKYQLTESIHSLIRNGENEKVEFKASLRYDYKKGQPNKSLEEVIAKSIASFLNADGGILIIGVTDEGHLLGLDNDYVSLGKQNRDGFEQRLMQIIATRLGADVCPLIHVTFHEIMDWEICSVHIEGARRPVYLREGDAPVFYLRIGNTTRPLNTQETVDFLKNKGIKFNY